MLMRSLKNTFRLLRIGYVLAKHNALFIFDALAIPFWVTVLCGIFTRPDEKTRPGQRLVAAIEEMGPTYVKLGQSLSTRADLIGDELAKDLSDLQDKIPPFAPAEARRIIEEQLGAPLTELFASFEDIPAAAASIAQVHFAKLHNGRDVAVKILRPNIEFAFKRDLELFFWLAEMLERSRAPLWRRLKPMQVVETFEQSIRFELDLRFEAAAAVELKHNLRNDTGFVVPEIHWTLTSQRVLTTDRVSGIPISDVERIKAAGHDTDAVLQHAAMSFFNQVFRDGYFHADLHPGNLFVLENGDIAVVDFGIMGRIDRDTRIFLVEILRGFLSEDYMHVARVHIEAGYVPASKSVEQFAQAARAIAKPILGRNLSEISVAKLLGQLFKIAETFEMEVQPQLLLLQKTMMVAEGVGRMLNPTVNMWQVAEPLVEAWARENLGPAARIRDAVEDGASMLQRLPRLVTKLDRLLDEVHTRAEKFDGHFSPEQQERRIGVHKQWQTIAWAVIGFVVVFKLLG